MRFRLRSVFGLVLLCSILAYWMARGAREREAVRNLESMGFEVNKSVAGSGWYVSTRGGRLNDDFVDSYNTIAHRVGALHISGITAPEDILVSLKLKNLRMLELEYIQNPTASFPDPSLSKASLRQLAECHDLRVLSLEFLKLRDEQIAFVENLLNLEEANLASNSLTAKGVRKLAELPKLHTLNLDTNFDFAAESGFLDDEAFALITSIGSLRSLSIANNEIGDKGLAHIGRLEAIEVLNIFGNQITESGLSKLRSCSNLRDLTIGGDLALSDEGIANLAKCPSLEKLTIFSPVLTAKRLEDFPKLEILSIRGENVTDANLPEFQLEDLRVLDLSDTRISGERLEELKQIPTLVSLCLDNTPLTEKGIRSLCSLKSLRRLSLDRVPYSGSLKKHLQKTLPNCDIIWPKDNFERWGPY